VDVRIGLVHTARELEIQLPDDTDAAALEADVTKALAGDGDGGAVWLTDRKGNRVGIAAERIAYISIGNAADKSKIGFGG
jgi:hypothetical protein